MKIAFLSSSEVSIISMTEAMEPYAISICRDRITLVTDVVDCEVLIVQNKGFPFHIVDADILTRAKKLRLIQHHGVSYDGTDAKTATRKGIVVATTSGTNSQSVAEIAFYLLLSIAKKARLAQKSVREGKIGEVLCTELAGKTLCVVGFGRIGKIIARFAKAFSMKLLAVKRTIDVEVSRAAGADAVFSITDLHQALALADFVVLSLPLTEESFDLIGPDEFTAMKPGAGLINISRGPHVNRAALEDALASGRLGGYAADVYWSEPADPSDPLLSDERVTITPHIGAESADAMARMSRSVRENVDRFMRGEPVQDAVYIR